jgi:S1-C subfamily serine protease
MHEERNGGEQPPEGHNAWPASPDDADDHVWPTSGAGQAWVPSADAATQPGAEDTGPLTPHAQDPMASRLEGAGPLVFGADEPGPLSPGGEGADQGRPDAAEPVSPDAERTGPLVPGLGAPAHPGPAQPGTGYEHPTVAYPGAPPPPPPPGSYGPPGGGYPGGYSGGGYPGGQGYPGAGYPGASYPGGGHVSGGYPGSGYQGGYQDGGYQGGGYQGGGYQGGGYQDGGYQDGGYQDGGYQDGGYQDGGYQDGGYQGGGYPGASYPGGGQPGGYGTGSYGAYPGDPGYGSYGDGGRPKRANRVITYVLVAALAAGVGAGTVLAMRHSSNNSTSFSLPGAGAVPQPGSGSTGGGANSSTTQSVIKKVGPGIVDVISTPSYQPGGTLEGTGMILNSTGLVLTNNHVVEGTSHEIARIANTGQQYSVTVIGTDDTDDVALLQLNGAKGLKPVPIGNSSAVQMGQSVVALGNADGEDGAPKVVTGSITDLSRSIEASDAGAGTTESLHGMLQTNAPIVEGDSGGALASTQGLVIGMDTAANTQNSTGQSMGFAIPINRALSIARQIAAGNTTSGHIQLGYPAFLGVTVARSGSNPSSSTSLQTQLRELQQAASQQGASGLGGLGGSGRSGGCLSTSQATAPQSAPNVSSGVLIGGVLCSTPVASAGLTTGAVITSIDSQPVTSPAQLTKVLEGYKPNQSITLTWVTTSGQHKTSKMTLISGPAK